MSADNEITAIHLLADKVRSLANQIGARQKVDDERYAELRATLNQLKKISSTVSNLQSAYDEFDLQNVPPRKRALFPSLMEWWEEHGERTQSWRFYLPLALGLVGPIIGGIAVEILTHHG